jgi:Activator of 2-hydroxyglutaryl-CoA dehydratase (HSP70-class ATPase domain)
MKTAGCDIGSRTAKAVIFENNTIISSAVIPAKLDPIESSETEKVFLRFNADDYSIDFEGSAFGI